MQFFPQPSQKPVFTAIVHASSHCICKSNKIPLAAKINNETTNQQAFSFSNSYATWIFFWSGSGCCLCVHFVTIKVRCFFHQIKTAVIKVRNWKISMEIMWVVWIVLDTYNRSRFLEHFTSLPSLVLPYNSIMHSVIWWISIQVQNLLFVCTWLIEMKHSCDDTERQGP